MSKYAIFIFKIPKFKTITNAIFVNMAIFMRKNHFPSKMTVFIAKCFESNDLNQNYYGEDLELAQKVIEGGFVM